LNAKGFGPLAADGVFGKLTEEAVIQFQQSANLDADGLVGPKTRSALFAEQERAPPQATLEDAKHELTLLLAGDLSAISVCEEAIRWLGVTEDPPGSNRIQGLTNGYADHWHIRYDEEEPAYPWCAIAVSQWMRQGLGLGGWDTTPFGKWFGGVWQIRKWADERGSLYGASGHDSASGEIFLMSRTGSFSDPSRTTRAGHCGLVLADHGDRIITIEGNTSNGVRSMTRKKSAIESFVRWGG
tara:strand:+ start:181 stop:903 length:723 start_codon:yes stop_codon:yes gene_type:complete